MFTVRMQTAIGGDEQEVYFCQEQPTYDTVIVETDNDLHPTVAFRFLVFTPTNGRQPGRAQRVPFEKILSVSE